MDRIVIVGGGISGLSLAHFILERQPPADVMIFESEKRAGGKIWTDKVNGFLCESGVNGFLDNKPKTIELAGRLMLNPLRSSDAARKRYIFSNGKLNLLPESPASFFTSNLLSISGRLRIIFELFAPKGNADDETLADFARRRLGREAYEKLIDPMASGIYAGNPETLSLKSCFPRIYELENKYGSLIRGMIKLQKKAKKSGKPRVGAGPGGTLTSFHAGMSTVIDSLKNALKDRLRIGSRVSAVEKKGKAYAIHLSDGSIVETDILVIAAPAYAASEILKNLDRPLSSLIAEIQYPAVSVVCFGYKRDRIAHNLSGFGFLAPYREKRNILGVLWDSSIFPNRAPEGYVLLRSMVGGVRASETAMLDDKKLADIVANELKAIMDINAQPDFVRIYRHEKAIPQYNIGHSNRLKIIDEMLFKHNGLYLTGNAFRGIAFNDCIENSYKLAEKIAEKEEG